MNNPYSNLLEQDDSYEIHAEQYRRELEQLADELRKNDGITVTIAQEEGGVDGVRLKLFGGAALRPATRVQLFAMMINPVGGIIDSPTFYTVSTPEEHRQAYGF